MTAQVALRASARGADNAKTPSSAQSHANAATPHQASPRSPGRSSARARTAITENELLSGVNLSNEQKSAIDQIHHDMRSKMEIVAKDENETPEQKSAMLEGLNRMQLRQVFDVLKPEQRDEVRKRISAMRAANRQGSNPSPQQKSH
jgi:hypothetical protein